MSKKESQLEEKKRRRIDIEEKKKDEENLSYENEKEIKELLEFMDEAEYSEHEFLKSDLLEALHEPFSFEIYQKEAQRRQEKIQKGLEILRQSESYERQVEELLKKRELKQKSIDEGERRIAQLEDLLVQVENEWKEKLYAWNFGNEEFKLPREFVNQLSLFAVNYNEESDFSIVRQQVGDEWINYKSQLEDEKRQIEEQIHQLKSEQKEVQIQLREWEKNKEPEPIRSEAVLQNRKYLRQNRIPYKEFYKLVEFEEGTSESERNQLEEALLEMGILDALVIDEKYKNQVLKSVEGCKDQYLFVKGEKLLEKIIYNRENRTLIAANGSYQLGLLYGTITNTYKAKFIGVQAREEHRRAQIKCCKEELYRLEQAISSLEISYEQLKSRQELLKKEYEAFPTDVDLKQAFSMLQEKLREDTNLREDYRKIEEEFLLVNEKLKAVKKEVLELADRLYLTCNYKVFVEAEKSMREYIQNFYRLQSAHNVYLQRFIHLNDLTEQLENLDIDMDEILYDIRNTERVIGKASKEFESVKQQLQLTDYEQIKERLNFCMNWLRDYPKKLQTCVQERTQAIEQIKLLQAELAKKEELIQSLELKAKELKAAYEAEEVLGYVELPEEIKANYKKVRSHLSGECQLLSKETIVQNLNNVYFENRGYLNDYQLTFVAEEERWAIYARYQGVKISFGELLLHLDEDIYELQQLLKDGDRELFEDILSNTISRKIRAKINASISWVNKMNGLMQAMNTSSGLKLSLRWRSKTAENENQLDTKDLVELLKKDYRSMKETEASRLSAHFRSKVEEARRVANDSGETISFYQVMKETLDYRKWFEFRLYSQKSGERQKELTNSVFGTFSGGEKAMAMYIPLFSAVVAKYAAGRKDAPRLISLDEAFAGVDNKNIRDMFRLMTEFGFDFIINSQVLWGDCDTLDALAIYQLLRPENAKFVTVMPYVWNGKIKEMMEDERAIEKRAAELL
ncbi:hypothetical protein P261_00934 [Lachnospiraceae bacterium TWA4]|nr:hypothetical protein P261_00934 [Lachnospiraceae bacterium TWA4]